MKSSCYGYSLESESWVATNVFMERYGKLHVSLNYHLILPALSVSKVNHAVTLGVHMTVTCLNNFCFQFYGSIESQVFLSLVKHPLQEFGGHENKSCDKSFGSMSDNL